MMNSGAMGISAGKHCIIGCFICRLAWRLLEEASRTSTSRPVRRTASPLARSTRCRGCEQMAKYTPKGREIEPLEGSPDAVDTAAQVLEGEAELMEGGGKLITLFAEGEVTGLAGNAVQRIGADCGENGQVLTEAATRYRAMVSTMRTYSKALREHQKVISTAIDELRELEREADAAAETWDELKTEVEGMEPDDPQREDKEQERDAAAAVYDQLYADWI